MFANQQEAIYYQVALTLLQQMQQKQLVITTAFSNGLKSAQSLPEIDELICIMSKLTQIEEENNENAISKASPLDYCRFIKSFVFICFFDSKKKCPFSNIQKILKVIDQFQQIYSQTEFSQLKQQIERLFPGEQRSFSTIRLLMNQFQGRIKEVFAGSISTNEIIDYLFEQIKVVERCIRRSFYEKDIKQIQFVLKMKKLFLSLNHLKVEFEEWKQIGLQNKCRLIEEGLDFAFASQKLIKSTSISHVFRQQFILINRVLQKYPQLQYLSLTSCELGNEVVPILKDRLCLRQLDLGYNHINDAGVKQLSEVKYQQLTKFVICSNPVTNKGLYYLAKADWPFLADLSLENCPVTKDGIKLYTKLASEDISLKMLHLNVHIIDHRIQIKEKGGAIYKEIRQSNSIDYEQQ